jgi:hypothetical protein
VFLRLGSERLSDDSNAPLLPEVRPLPERRFSNRDFHFGCPGSMPDTVKVQPFKHELQGSWRKTAVNRASFDLD